MRVCGNILSNGTACGKELVCVKTGTNVRVNPNYFYACDLFECPKCKTRVALCNSNGCHVSQPEKIIDDFTIDLNQG